MSDAVIGGIVLFGAAAAAYHYGNPQEQQEMADLRPPLVDASALSDYLIPKSLEPQALAVNEFIKGEYRGIGLNQGLTLIHPHHGRAWRCDMVYFVKKDDQIGYEQRNRKWLSIICGASDQEIQTRIAHQVATMQRISLVVSKKLLEWNYDSFFFYPSDSLADAGFSDDDKKKMHALVLFYKKPQKLEQPAQAFLSPPESNH